MYVWLYSDMTCCKIIFFWPLGKCIVFCCAWLDGRGRDFLSRKAQSNIQKYFASQKVSEKEDAKKNHAIYERREWVGLLTACFSLVYHYMVISAEMKSWIENKIEPSYSIAELLS